jgi:hypothetical protein
LSAFRLEELVDNVHYFNHLAGYREIEYRRQEAVNVRAAETMGKLHDQLKAIGYTGHQLELYLVRLLFILFAEVSRQIASLEERLSVIPTNALILLKFPTFSN